MVKQQQALMATENVNLMFTGGVGGGGRGWPGAEGGQDVFKMHQCYV